MPYKNLSLSKFVSMPAAPVSTCHLLVPVLMLFFICVSAQAQSQIFVNQSESGTKRTGANQIFHDPQGSVALGEAIDALSQGKFSPLNTAGSSGLKPGAIWSHFVLKNQSDQALSLHLEYVDHQLIHLQAYQGTYNEAIESSDPIDEASFEKIAELDLDRPFSHRPIPHNRFVVPVELPPNGSSAFLIRFNKKEGGFTFPSMRIWSPENLRSNQSLETAGVAFLFGGFFLMSLFALIGGIATGERAFFAYSLYSFTKITVWATVLGYTHQLLLKNSFHWSYMSISGSITIFCGLLFARTFLKTRIYTPRLDYLLLLMMTNAILLFLSAVFGIKVLAIITITLALFLYPVLIVVAIIRWRQGAIEAGVFAIAWSFLVVGLVVQALRDMGFVAHNFLNYYWPPVASFVEMLTIMFAMGILVRSLQQQKRAAETRYRQHLEESKTTLEQQVKQRTEELEQAKRIAEQEALTDSLTGIQNRRSFMLEAEKAIKLSQRKSIPLTLLMFDLDHFKAINDNFGHIAGDTALVEFTRIIRESIRDTDIFGRLGGEEFGLILCEPENSAIETAERLRIAIAEASIVTSEGAVQLTVSIGIACWRQGNQSGDLLQKADKALYQAKKNGRNRVTPYQ